MMFTSYMERHCNITSKMILHAVITSVSLREDVPTNVN